MLRLPKGPVKRRRTSLCNRSRTTTASATVSNERQLDLGIKNKTPAPHQHTRLKMVFAAVGTWWHRESTPDLGSSPHNLEPDAVGARLAFEANATAAKTDATAGIKTHRSGARHSPGRGLIGQTTLKGCERPEASVTAAPASFCWLFSGSRLRPLR